MWLPRTRMVCAKQSTTNYQALLRTLLYEMRHTTQFHPARLQPARTVRGIRHCAARRSPSWRLLASERPSIGPPVCGHVILLAPWGFQKPSRSRLPSCLQASLVGGGEPRRRGARRPASHSAAAHVEGADTSGQSHFISARFICSCRSKWGNHAFFFTLNSTSACPSPRQSAARLARSTDQGPSSSLFFARLMTPPTLSK